MIAGYSVEEGFEEGSYAWVHFGVRESDNAPVAVKFARESDQKSLERFMFENRILRELDGHPNIVRAYTEVGKATRGNAHKHYYVMERLKCNLSKWLDTAFTSDSYEVKVAIVKQIYATIKMIHDKNYVHRDLHEGNILMDIVGGAITPKLSDFGSAYDLSRPKKLTKPNKLMWGDLLLPPEIAFGIIDADDPNYKNGDYYAAGMLVKVIFIGGFDTEGFLCTLQGSIQRFKQKATGQMSDRYLSARKSREQRYQDYLEWCSAESAKFNDACKFDDLEDDELAAKLSVLVEKSSNLDYNQRENNPDELMRFVNGI